MFNPKTRAQVLLCKVGNKKTTNRLLNNIALKIESDQFEKQTSSENMLLNIFNLIKRLSPIQDNLVLVFTRATNIHFCYL